MADACLAVLYSCTGIPLGTGSAVATAMARRVWLLEANRCIQVRAAAAVILGQGRRVSSEINPNSEPLPRAVYDTLSAMSSRTVQCASLGRSTCSQL